MRLNVYAEYPCIYDLTKRELSERSSYGQIELSQDEYFAFEKAEIEFYEWQDKIKALLGTENEK